MTLNIRRIREEDLDKLAEIFTEVYAKFDVGERWNKKAAYSMLSYWIKKSPDLCFLGEYDGRIVGAFCTCVKPWWDGNHLSDAELFVHPDYQKKRIGTELLKFVLDYTIKKYQVVSFDAFTFRGKYPLKWYEKIGFKEIKEWAMISCSPSEVLKKLK